jgi:hypothetical protein
MVEASGVAWSPRFVAAAIRHPVSVRMYSEAPYLAELYGNDLETRIFHPANAEPRDIARPFLLRRGLKHRYLPGSADDLILHTSCVIACCSAVVRYMPADSDAFDCGPPLLRELSAGSFGFHHTMQYYWTRLGQMIERHPSGDFSHALFADVAQCIENIDLGQMWGLLREAGADECALRWLERLHDSWQQSGCRGLPMTPGFMVLLKLYLTSVDDRLRSHGFHFGRLQDDFRVLCHDESEARHALSVLSGALASRGLTLNEKKTHIFNREEIKRSWQRRRVDLARIFGQGIGQPALSDALSFPVLRPPALLLLRLFYGHRCQRTHHAGAHESVAGQARCLSSASSSQSSTESA